MDDSKTTQPNLQETSEPYFSFATSAGEQRCVVSGLSTLVPVSGVSLTPEMFDRAKALVLNSASANCGGPPISSSVMERAFERLKSREPGNTELLEKRIKDYKAYAKARYARFLGVESLSPEQERRMWDGVSEAYARHIGLIDAEGNLN